MTGIFNPVKCKLPPGAVWRGGAVSHASPGLPWSVTRLRRGGRSPRQCGRLRRSPGAAVRGWGWAAEVLETATLVRTDGARSSGAWEVCGWRCTRWRRRDLTLARRIAAFHTKHAPLELLAGRRCRAAAGASAASVAAVRAHSSICLGGYLRVAHRCHSDNLVWAVVIGERERSVQTKRHGQGRRSRARLPDRRSSALPPILISSPVHDGAVGETWNELILRQAMGGGRDWQGKTKQMKQDVFA